MTDKEIFLFINSIQNKFLDVLFFTIDWIGELGLLWIAVCLLILVFNKRKALIVLASLALSFVITDVFFRLFFFRLRPYLALEGVRTIGKIWANSSFPSGHTASAAAAIVAIIFLYKIKSFWKLSLLLGFILLTGLARIYSGMHYPSDVLAGILVGIISALLVIQLSLTLDFKA